MSNKKSGAPLHSQGQAFRAFANAPFLRKLRNAFGGSPILSPKILRFFSACIFLFLLFFLFLRFSPYPALTSLKNRNVSTRIYDAGGKILQILPLENGLRREFVPLEEIPSFIQEIFIESEDKKFYAHHGIDFAAITRAFFQNASQGRTVSGASTITMQLARIISPSQKRNILVKIRESIDALRLEARLSKKEILELYLNNLPFGFNTEGVASAARNFFSKEIKNLNEVESACLAVIVRRPSLYNPLTNPENCARAAFELMQDSGHSLEEFEKTARSAHSFRYPFHAPHFVRYLSNLENSPLRKKADLSTSLILEVQEKAEDLLSTALERYAENRLSNGAILICDTKSGEILAWLGSGDFFDREHDGQVDGVLSLQQPGSSMKPFLYALALESGFSPNSILPDIPMEFGFEKLYLPQNFNNRFNGPVRLRVALASSLNIPAVYLLNEIGIEKYKKKLMEIGFVSLEKADPGLSLALGGAEVSLFEMVQAFSLFARDGLFRPLYGINDEKMQKKAELPKKYKKGSSGHKEVPVFDMNTARLICDILSDKEERALGFGFSQTFTTPFPAMFKTGTANQYQNITALASTPQYTVGVWMGNFSGETVIGKTGSSIPAKIARDLLLFLQGNKGEPFKKPAQFKKERICSLSGKLAGENCPDTVKEYIAVSGNADSKAKCDWHTKSGTTYPAEYTTWFRLKNRSGIVDDKGSPLKIISPRRGSVFYYDQSIRQDQQKLVVEASGGSEETARFFVDGRFFCESRRPFLAQVPIERGEEKISVQCGEESTEIVILVK